MNHPKQTCLRKHYCDRRAFNERQGYGEDHPSYEYKYELYAIGTSETGEDEQVLACNEDSELNNYLFANNYYPGSLVDLLAGKQVGNHRLTVNGICKICDMYDKRKADLKEGRVLPLYIVVSGVSRYCYSRAEGGCWADWITIHEVRQSFTFRGLLKHMRELKSEYPQQRYNRFSCANRGGDDYEFTLCYGEDDPRWPKPTMKRETYE